MLRVPQPVFFIVPVSSGVLGYRSRELIPSHGMLVAVVVELRER